MIRKVEVLPYQNEWKERFLVEKDVLVDVFHPHDVKVHHIGSTSVHGLAAKPIIDVIAEAKSLDIFDEYTPKLEKLGYEARGENGIPGRRYFVKISPQGERLIHLHAFKAENIEIERHLVFRDYLRKHPEQAAKYGGIKMNGANKFPWDIAAYIEYKDSVIKELEQLAFEWQKGQPKSV